MLVDSPSALIRVIAFFYIQWLKLLHECFSNQAWLTTIVPPSTILYFCLFIILSIHIPALRSQRINLYVCVMQLEKSLMYFGILQIIIVIWGDGSAVVNTCGALCMGWYVWIKTKRDWLPIPDSMRLSLGIYFMVCVPLLWIFMPIHTVVMSKTNTQRLSLLASAFLCDISLLSLECLCQVYGRLWELMLYC